MDSDGFDQRLSSAGGSINGSARKESFYRRVSFHHFHVVQDQMACCCCVPLGMALHIVAGLDVIFMIFLVIQGFDYMYSAAEDQRAKDVPVVKQHYQMVMVDCFAAVLLYSIPRTIMYFFMLGRQKSYSRIRLYFRARILTLILLGLLLLASFVLILINAQKLAAKEAYDLTRTYVVLMAFVTFMTWVGIDLYWSIAIRTYKDTKKGKKGEEVAKKLSTSIDPNSFIMDNVKETRYNSSIED